MGHHSHSHDSGTRGHVIHWAPLYQCAFGPFLRRTHAAVVALAGPRAGERVLDVGCGTGSLTIALRPGVGPTGSVHGVDASEEMIAVARRNVARSGADVHFQPGLAERLPFPDGMFDLVVSQLAVHHLPGDLKGTAMREMRRVLKGGGRCLIVDFEPPKSVPGRLAARLVLGSEMMRIHVEDYRPLLEGAGFTRIETGRTAHTLLSFVRGEVAR